MLFWVTYFRLLRGLDRLDGGFSKENYFYRSVCVRQNTFLVHGVNGWVECGKETMRFVS